MTINEYWEARLAEVYAGTLARMGWDWTMALIDEDIVLYGEEDNHEAARRGLRELQDALFTATPLTRRNPQPVDAEDDDDDAYYYGYYAEDYYNDHHVGS